MSKTSICIVSPEAIGPFTNGGVGTAAYRLAELLSLNQYPVTLLYTGEVMPHVREDWKKHYYDDRAIEFLALDEWCLNNQSMVSACKDSYLAEGEALVAIRVHAFFKSRHFDVIYFQEFMGNGLRVIQAKKAGLDFQYTALVLWCHSSFLWSLRGNKRFIRQPKHLQREAHERLSAQAADVVATPSRYMSQTVADDWHVSLPLALPLWSPGNTDNTDYTGSDGPAYTHFQDFRHLVFFGRLERRKGLDLLVNAISRSPVIRDNIERITFLGRQVLIDNMTGEQYIQRTFAGLDVNWQILDNFNTDEALAWLSSQQQVLVVMPSLLDNFPFTVTEIYLNHLPFVSTNVGGIREIVGEKNAQQLLVQPNVSSLQNKLEHVLLSQQLTVDYTEGYDPADAAKKIIAFQQKLEEKHVVEPATATPLQDNNSLDVVVLFTGVIDDIRKTLCSLLVDHESKLLGSLVIATHLVTDHTEQALRALIAEFDRAADLSVWNLSEHNHQSWLSDESEHALLVMRAGETIHDHALQKLAAGLRQGRYALISGYVARHGRGGEIIIDAPTGMAIELGLLNESIAITPIMLTGSNKSVFLELLQSLDMRIHPTVVEFACRVGNIGVLPEIVAQGGAVPTSILADNTKFQLAEIYKRYSNQLRGELLYPLMVKDACSGVRDAYYALTRIDESLLMDELQEKTHSETIPLLVERLGPLVAKWLDNPPHLFVFGAGEHSKVMLTLFPVLWQWIDAFIDNGITRDFLGKPCQKPADSEFPPGAVVLYSSREYELAMCESLKGRAVTHILIYHGQAPDSDHPD